MKEGSKQGQTNKAKQHSTPKAVTFPRKNELPRVGFEPTILHTLDMYMYMYISCGSEPWICTCTCSFLCFLPFRATMYMEIYRLPMAHMHNCTSTMHVQYMYRTYMYIVHVHACTVYGSPDFYFLSITILHFQRGSRYYKSGGGGQNN